ncbi:MAG: hypothetical protein FWG64_13495 [Firmicutes bacterium]|nr:hypothetical protein [Bacillota bacterium]
MSTYVILANPGHNRVYFKASQNLALTEFSYLKIANLENIQNVNIGGLPYVQFDTQNPLTTEELQAISRLSFAYAIFEKLPTSLLPLEKQPNYLFDEDISTILKYNGKTNEIFTRMLLNIGVSLSPKNNLNILDPLCGKGTTIFEGLLCGYNMHGIDVDQKSVDEAYTFLKKYLELGKYKHSSHKERQGLQNYTATRQTITLKNPQNPPQKLTAEFVTAETKDTSQLYRKNYFDIIIADLPYGVQHKKTNNKAKHSQNQNTESRLPLVTQSLPAWHKVLSPKGVIILAYNLFLIAREELEQELTNNGFSLVMPKGDKSCIHRVDQAINRDIIIGIKL